MEEFKSPLGMLTIANIVGLAGVGLYLNSKLGGIAVELATYASKMKDDRVSMASIPQQSNRISTLEDGHASLVRSVDELRREVKTVIKGQNKLFKLLKDKGLTSEDKKRKVEAESSDDSAEDSEDPDVRAAIEELDGKEKRKKGKGDRRSSML